MQASLVNLYAFNCTLRWHCRMTLRVYLLHLLSGPSVIGWNYSTCFSQLPYAPAANWLIRSFHDIALMHVWCVNITCFKGHRQRISTVGYKTIFRTINIEETFLPYICHLQSLQIKTIFQEKSSVCEIHCRGICDLYLWSWRHSLVPFMVPLVTIAILLVNIVYLLIYFIVMVYCVAFGCNSNSCSSENISFFCFPAAWSSARPENGKMKCFHY